MWKRFHKKKRTANAKEIQFKGKNHNIFCETSLVVFEEFQAYNAQKLVAIGILHILFLSLPMFWTQKTSPPPLTPCPAWRQHLRTGASTTTTHTALTLWSLGFIFILISSEQKHSYFGALAMQRNV